MAQMDLEVLEDGDARESDRAQHVGLDTRPESVSRTRAGVVYERDP